VQKTVGIDGKIG